MPLEIYKFRQFSQEALGFGIVPEGEHRTIVNLNSKDENEIIVLYCRKDNKLSVAYTIHPLRLLAGESKTAAYFKEDTENRALKIKPGKVEEILVREKIGPRKTELFRYKLSHR